MQPDNQCHYDFTYSVTFDCTPAALNYDSTNLQKQFFEWIDIFSNLPMLAQSSNCKSASFLFKIPTIHKLGLQLLSICNYAQGTDKDSQHKDEQLEKCRESIYACLKQLDLILGKDKLNYLSLIAICFYSIIQRTIQVYSEIDDQFTIFHIVFWELKGQLANQQTMEELIRKYLNVDFFHKYMYWEKESLIHKYLRAKNQMKNSVQPLTFRASIAKQGLNNKSTVLYQSFKEIPLVKSKNYSKQNCSNNFQDIQSEQNDDLLVGKLKFNHFKKHNYQGLKADRLGNNDKINEMKCISFKKNLHQYTKQLSPKYSSALNSNLGFRGPKVGYFNSQFSTRN